MGVSGWWRSRSTRTERAAAPRQGRVRGRVDLDPDAPVLGLDACRAGWVGALLDPSGHGTPRLIVAATAAQALAQAPEATVVGIDIPIGLPDASRREADVQTRRFLGGAKASSVFTTPVREAIFAPSYQEANLINRARIGAGLSQQAYALRRSIQDVDALVREELTCLVVEVHPEASFAMMTGTALISRKRTGEGAQERREALASVGITVPAGAPHGVGTDDLIDACAVAWSAQRVKTGRARTFPPQPEIFSDGIPAAIHV